ncbi:MAG: rhomboid family intramembrane serine protease [Myxococcales bacterium]
MDLERLVKIAAVLGFNPVSVRWKLAKLQRRLGVRRQQARAHVNQLRYAHKICPHCGRLVDRADKSCVSCGERASSWLVHFLGRLGVKAPALFSASGLLGVLILAAYARVAVAGGGGLVGFDSVTLLQFGGHAPWLVHQGEWWRLFTAMFLHIGLWHLLFNLVALSQLGPAVEQAIGRGWMLLLFLMTGLCGNLGSELWGLHGVAAGASGALLGLTGFTAVWGHRQGTSIGRSIRDRMLRWALLTVVFGFLVSADNAAHVFGFLSGGLLGLAVRPGRLREDWRRLAGLVAGALGVAAVGGVLALVMPADRIAGHRESGSALRRPAARGARSRGRGRRRALRPVAGRLQVRARGEDRRGPLDPRDGGRRRRCSRRLLAGAASRVLRLVRACARELQAASRRSACESRSPPARQREVLQCASGIGRPLRRRPTARCAY